MTNGELILSDRQKDGLAVTSILLVLIIRFYQTIFFGQSITKNFLTAHWDSLFYNFRAGQNLSMDPSFCYFSFPCRFFVSEYWHHGLPLWNSLNGFGMPLLADPQSLLFSPLYVFFTLVPAIHTWNLLLIAQLAIAGLSVYFLCRTLHLGFTAGLIGALIFTFCPFFQWQIDLLGPGICLTPFVFLFFTRMAKKGSFWNIVLAGMAAAIDILSSHPEIAFITILFAVIWTGFCCYSNDPHAMLSWLRVASLRIALAGAIAFGLCAPMFIPFVEYAANAESYKLQTIAAAGLPWQALLANYLFPFQPKASIFFGPLSLWGLIASFLFFDKANRFAKPLIVCFFISLIGVIRPIPFSILFHLPPLSMTFATYWLPEYILFISVLTGLGSSYLINKLFQDSLFQDKKRIFAFIITGLILLVIPLQYTDWHFNNSALIFDQTFEKPFFNWKVWLSNTCCTVTALLILFAGMKKSILWKRVACSLFVVVGLTSLIALSLRSLPLRPHFEYPETLPLTVDNQSDRILSIGNHLFSPNLNLIYQLPSVRTLSPIFPKGFIAFTKACGAQTDQYTQIFSPIISPLLRLACVNKIISEQPILDNSILEKQSSTKKIADNKTVVSFENFFSLHNLKLLYDAKASTIFLSAQGRLLSPEKYLLCFSVEDNNGKSLNYIEPTTIADQPNKQDIFCSSLIPRSAAHWSVSVRLMRGKDFTFISPTKITFGKVLPNKSWLIASNDQPESFSKISNDRFELVSQHGSILEYKDKTAFKRCFFANKILWVPDNTSALTYLKAHPEQLDKVAILEKKDSAQFNSIIKTLYTENSSKPKEAINFGSGIIEIPSNNHNSLPFATASEFSFQTATKEPAFLVASDIYYPGWNAYVDDNKTNIFRTDYLFRGILIPTGKHIITFTYQPISLTVGFWLFFITVEMIIILALRKRYLSNGKTLTFKKSVTVKL